MPPRTRIVLAVLLILTLACQAVMAAWQAPLTPTPAPTGTPATLPAWTLRPASPTPTSTPSPLPPTATPSPTPSPTIRPTASALQIQVFEDLWSTINEDYLYRDFNGLDWEAVHAEFRQKIEAGLSAEDYYTALEDMIARLGDEHSTFLSPEQSARQDSELEGEYDYVGIGVLTSVVPERRRITIILVFPGSPAELAGLQPHDSILAVNGLPIVEEDTIHRDLLRGPEGSQVVLTVQSPGEAEREVTLTRGRIASLLPVPYQVLTTPAGKRAGYILLPTFHDETVDDQVEEALRVMSAGSRLDGLVIDNRQNEGGTSDIFSRVLSFFTRGTLGHFINRHNQESLHVTGQDVDGSQRIPLVVLVGEGTASFGEIFSGILKDTGRAYLIGETTLGNVEILYVYDFDDGSQAWIAHDTFRPLQNPDQNWEETGVIPDLSVDSNWDEVTQDSDPVISAALEYLDRQ